MVERYIFSGSLPEDATTYVTREADTQLYEGLKAGKFCYVLNSRQTGKSSLRVRIMRRLREEDFSCVAIDLSSSGIQSVTPEQWYVDLLDTLIDNLELEVDLEEWWYQHKLLSPLKRFGKLIEEVLLVEVRENIVIFIDEIDSVLSLKFPTDDFFAFIRACYNQRADNPKYRRLSFCLLGVASPSELIADKKRTPFNIGQAIFLKGFQWQEVEPLKRGLQGKVDLVTTMMKEILEWTGGQPFLTQKLCQFVVEESDREKPRSVDEIVRTRIIENWESQDEPEHLKTIRDRILFRDKQLAKSLLELYQQIWEQGDIVTDNSLEQRELLLSGLVVRQQGKLKVYNQIYKQVFNQDWIERELVKLHQYIKTPSPQELDLHYEEIVNALIRGKLVFFLGWDINLYDRQVHSNWRPRSSAYFPSNIELASYLANQCDYPSDEELNFSRVSEYIAFTKGKPWLYTKLHSVLNYDYTPTLLHEFLARLPRILRYKGIKNPYQLIVTTNYDDALERAFQKAQEPFHVVYYCAEGKPYEPYGRFLYLRPNDEVDPIIKETDSLLLPENHTVIVKLCGTVNCSYPDKDSFIIGNYFERLNRKLLPTTLLEKLLNSHVLFLGCSVRDQNLRTLMLRIWDEQKFSEKSWLIESNPRRSAQAFFFTSGVDIFNIEIEKYCTELYKRVDTLTSRLRVDSDKQGEKGRKNIDHPSSIEIETISPSQYKIRSPYFIQKTPILSFAYRGLMPFFEEDAPFFFGREKEQKLITANLKTSRLTLLYGSRGVGKSSLLQAGVVHQLNKAAKENLANYGVPEFAVILFSYWRDDPLTVLIKQIEITINKLYGEVKGATFETVPQSSKLDETLQAWAELIGEKDEKGNLIARGKLFIILDQFEDYFLYHPDEIGEATFAVEFPRAVNRPNLPVNFLISIREESLAKLDRFKSRIPSLFDNYLRLKHLDAKSAYEAIVNPIEKYNELVSSEQTISIEPDLAQAVIAQVSQVITGGSGLGGLERIRTELEQQIETPYLQLVMTRLWQEEMNAGSSCLQLQTLQNLGGANKIVRDHLNKQMESLNQDEKKAAAKVFQYLVTPSGNKIAYPVLDLVELTKLSEKQLNNLLEKLSSGQLRILRPVAPSPSQPGVKRYEIFHNVLAQAILDWRKQYFLDEEKHRRNLTIKEGLPAQSLRNRYIDETAALLARQAYLFYRRERNKVFYQIDDALREVLSKNYFSNILLGHESEISEIAFNPKNPQMLASADHKGIIKLWDLRRFTGVPQLITVKHQFSSVNALAFSPDGKMLASGGSDYTVRLWNLDNPNLPYIIPGKHNKKVTSIAFNWNGTILASGSDDCTIKLWNLENLSEIGPPLGGHEDAVKTVAFSPDKRNGYLLASGSKDEKVRLWDITDSMKPCLQVLKGHSGVVRSVAFSPNGHMLASGSDDQQIRLWDLSSSSHANRTVAILDEDKHEGRVSSVAFSQDGRILASGSEDQTVCLWQISSSDRKLFPLTRLRMHDFGISAVAFSPDNQILASGSWDKTIRSWHLHPSEASPQILGRHDDNVMSVAVSPNGRWLASGGWDNIVQLWDLTKNQPKPQVLKAKEHQNKEDKVLAVAFDQKGQMLASASSDKIIRLWNLQNLEQDPEKLEGHTNGVSSVAFSPDGRWLVSGSWQKDQDAENDDRTVRLWDLKVLQDTGETVGKILWRHKKSVISVAFSPDGQMLASGSDEGIIQLLDLRQAEDLSWDVIYEQSGSNFPEDLVLCPRIANLVTEHKGRFISIKDHQARVWSVAFSPNSEMLASGSDDRTIRLWDLSQEEPQPKPITFKDHHFWVGSVAFSPDGQKLASGSYDKNIRVWDLDYIDEDPIVLRGHKQGVTSVAFYPDGKKLVSGSYDNTIRQWIVDTQILADMVCDRVLCNLSQKDWNWFMGEDIPYERTCPNLPPGEKAKMSETLLAQEINELKRDFRDKLDQLFPGQKDLLEFIEEKTAQQPDISEEDVTNFQNKSQGDTGTFYQLDTLRLLGFLEITDEDKKSETKRYGLSPRYQKYLSITKSQYTDQGLLSE